MAELDCVKICQELIVQERQAVADSEVVLKQGHLPTRRVPRDGEFRPADLLSMKEVTDRLNGLELIIEVRLEVELHGGRLKAADGFEAVLLENGGEIGFPHIVDECAIAEDDSSFAGRLQLLVPSHNP